jgi:phage/plasmid-like protein (TIGR03299 family)
MDAIQSLIDNAFSGLKLQDAANSERVASLLDQFDLRWTVSKQPLYLADGTETSYKAVVRDDNKQVFQTCKDSYSPYQNSEMAELLIRIADKGGYQIHDGGYFKGGAKTFVQLISGNELKDIGKNRTKVVGYTTGLNSHDGSMSLKWGSTNKTICCQNVFNAVSKQLGNSARHTTRLQDKVDMYLSEIGAAILQERSIFNTFVRLSETPLQQHQITKVVKEITGVDIMQTRNEAEKNFSTYNINRSEELLTSISKEVNQKGETLWGLFSGVTNYTTHRIPVPNRENARQESKYVGTASQIDNRVFDLVSSFN